MDSAKYVLEFDIEKLPRLPNQLLGSHWRTRSGYAKQWQRTVWRCCWHLKPDEPLRQAKLTLTRFSSRVPDPDGLAGSFKAVVDGLVKAAILIDDSMDVIGMPEYRHEVVGANKGRIRVKVEEV